MRSALLPHGSPVINYGIREIVSKGMQVEKLGTDVIWENIGDPVQKGLSLPLWIREKVSARCLESSSYAYCDSKGLLETRRFLAARTSARGSTAIDETDITFFNGLGDAIARLYSHLSPDVRVLMPSPTYPAHYGSEKNRIRTGPLQYRLDPKNGWLPDIAHVRHMVENHPEVCAILIINPDNPTGTVMPPYILEELVSIAREHGLFLIADEIYENVVFDGKMTRLSEVLDADVPAIAMKGISKDFPWPGSRCGWLEYYNRKADPRFNALCLKLDQSKMSEVCSTTLPQSLIPEVMADPRFDRMLHERNNFLKKRKSAMDAALSGLPGITLGKGGGATYAVIGLDTNMLPDEMPVYGFDMEKIRLYNQWMETPCPPDMKFIHYLLAFYGICAVPLSGFGSDVPGLRITLLEASDKRFELMLGKLKSAFLSLNRSISLNAAV